MVDTDQQVTEYSAGTIGGFIEALRILAWHSEKALNESHFISAERHVIYSHCSSVDIPRTAEDGRRLAALGWHLDYKAGAWAYRIKGTPHA